MSQQTRGHTAWSNEWRRKAKKKWWSYAPSRVQSASHTGPWICANTSVERKASSSTKSRLLCNQCCNERRLEQGERELTASKWRELVEQEAFSRKAVGSMWHGTSRTQSVETFHQQKKLGPDRFRQLQNVSGEVEQTAGGNMRRRTGRSSSLSRTTATSASEVC